MSERAARRTRRKTSTARYSPTYRATSLEDGVEEEAGSTHSSLLHRSPEQGAEAVAVPGQEEGPGKMNMNFSFWMFWKVSY